MLTSLPTLTQAPYWYTTRSTAIIAFVLLTAATALGVAATARDLTSRRWPRFTTQGLHRSISLLALGFLGVHVVTAIADGYVSISWWSVVVPWLSDYRRTWVALGTLAFDLLLAITVTSLLRLRLSASAWRAVHLSAYAVWPLAWVHFWKTGTDAAHGRFGFWLDLGAAGVVIVAGVIRLLTRDRHPTPLRAVAR